MKKAKNALLLALCAVLLVGATIAGTLAFLTDTDEVKNTFTVGEIGITLDEAKVNEYGVPVEGADRVKTNAYKLIPGKTYVKDPKIHVSANSEDSYIFVCVQNGLAAYEAAGETTIAKQMEAKGWAAVPNTTDVFYKVYNKNTNIVDIEVFDSFTIASSHELGADWNAAENAEITITAYAIQRETMTSVEAAWDIVSAEYASQG